MLKSLIEDISQELPEVSNTIQQLLGTIVDLKKDPVSVLEALIVKTCQARFHVNFLESLHIQVILFEIDCAIFYTHLHELFCPLNKLGKFW